VIAFGLAIAAFAAFQQFKMPVVMPVLLESYHYDRFLAGGFMSVYALIGLLFSIKLGGLLEKQGVIGPILLGLGLFVAGAGLTLALPQLGLVVLAGRALEGLGFAVMAIAGPVLANSNASPRQLPVVVGMTAAWIPIGQLSATALAGLGWERLWWLSIAGSVAFGLWAVALRRGNAGFIGLNGRPKHSQHKPLVLTKEQRRILLITAALFMLWSCQYFAYMTWLPQYLVEVYDLGVGGALLGYVVPVALVAICSSMTGFLFRAGLSIGWLATFGLTAQTLVWWTIPYIDDTTLGLVSLILYGSAGGIIPACLFAAPSKAMASGRDTAKAFGIVMTGRNSGVLIGPVLLAQVYKMTGTWDNASPIFGVITTLCVPLAVALALLLPRHRPASEARI
jgi:MFS family permease